MAKSVRKQKSRTVGRAASKARGRVGKGNGGVGMVDIARLQVAWPRQKQPVNLRIDSDIIEWFRQAGAGYQTRMNAVLRAFVDAQPKRR